MLDLQAKCKRVYEDAGREAVRHFIRSNHPEVHWSWCGVCRIESPLERSDCLVCGFFVKESPVNDS